MSWSTESAALLREVEAEQQGHGGGPGTQRVTAHGQRQQGAEQDEAEMLNATVRGLSWRALRGGRGGENVRVRPASCGFDLHGQAFMTPGAACLGDGRPRDQKQ